MISPDGRNISVAEEFEQDIRDEMRKGKWLQIAPIIILVLLAFFFSVATNAFFTFSNLLNLLNQLALPLIISVSVTFVIVMGSIDLSVEGMMAMTGSVFSVLVLNNHNDRDLGLFAIPIVLIIGAFAGLLIGLIHVKLKLPSFMVTYAASFVLLGLSLLSYGGIPASINDKFFAAIPTKSFLYVPIITWAALIMFIVAYIIQKRTTLGAYVFAIGSSEKILHSVGVRVNRVKLLVFMFSGFCLALAGIIAAIRLGRGEVLLGKGMMFPAFTAVVLGGTPMSGGRGGMLNTLIGAITVTVLQNGLVMLGVNPYIQNGIQGIIIVIAVIVSIKRGNRVLNK